MIHTSIKCKILVKTHLIESYSLYRHILLFFPVPSLIDIITPSFSF